MSVNKRREACIILIGFFPPTIERKLISRKIAKEREIID
jgi:hypothetical protein